MATRNDVIKVLGILADAYPQRSFANPSGFAETAVKILASTDAKALEQAALEWIAVERFYPTIAELVTRAAKASKKIQSRPMTAGAMESFAAVVERWEWMRPDEWTAEDHAQFKAHMGRPVNWETEDQNAPWMAWSHPYFVAWAKQKQEMVA